MEILGMDLASLAVLLSAGLTVLSSVLGIKYNKYSKILKELINMAEDGEITKEELRKFVKSLKNL